MVGVPALVWCAAASRGCTGPPAAAQAPIIRAGMRTRKSAVRLATACGRMMDDVAPRPGSAGRKEVVEHPHSSARRSASEGLRSSPCGPRGPLDQHGVARARSAAAAAATAESGRPRAGARSPRAAASRNLGQRSTATTRSGGRHVLARLPVRSGPVGPGSSMSLEGDAPRAPIPRADAASPRWGWSCSIVRA
jgi:hypothetical protein